MFDIRAMIAELDALLARHAFEDAGALLYESLRRCRAENNAGAAIGVYNELMGFERQYGSRDRAMEAAQAALALLKQEGLDNARPAAMVTLNAATVYRSAGEIARAYALYQEANRLFDRYYPAGDKAFAGLYNNMASVYVATGEYGKAEYYYDRAQALLKRHKDVCDLGVTWFNLAQLYALQGKKTAAGAAMWKGAAVMEVPPEARDSYYAYSCSKCAAACKELGCDELYELFAARADNKGA